MSEIVASPPPTPARGRALLWLTLVFGCGLVAGVGGTLLAVRWRIQNPPAGGFLERPLLAQMSRQLDLDEAQREKVRIAVRAARAELLALAERNEPEVHEILGRARVTIRAELRADQVDRFDREVEKRVAAIERIKEKLKQE